jgi:uncharacterized protein YbjT (DUF2867 family)
MRFAAPIAVVGASGHTGRFVVAELEHRGLAVREIARDLGKLPPRRRAVQPVAADVQNAGALDRALAGAAAVINCAGPYLDTALPVVDAALRAGISYFDLAAEQAAVQAVIAERSAQAEAAGVTLVPGAAFFGGLADLLASALAADDGLPDDLAIAVGLDSWHPTQGTRRTGERNRVPRLLQRNGRLQTFEAAPQASWAFPAPLDDRPVVLVPLSEIILIARHLPVRTITSWMNEEPLADLQDSDTPAPQAVDRLGRSAQRFVLDVVASRDGRLWRATAIGQDIYFVSARIMVEAVTRVLADRTPTAGVRTLGELHDPGSFLASLGPEIVRITYPPVSEHPLKRTLLDVG